MTPRPSPRDESQEGSACRKRKRVPTACGACRARKSRCDGDRPSCASCIELGLECVYAAASTSKDALVPKAYLDLVEARLASVEVDLRQVKAQVASSQASSHPNSSLDKPVCTGEFEVNNETFDDNDSEVFADATDGVGTIEFTSEKTSAYFGPSSNIAFTRVIRRTLINLLQRERGPISGSASRPQSQRHTLAASRPASPRHRSSGDEWISKAGDSESLPPEYDVKRLVGQYFLETGLLFPYINENTFWQDYHVFAQPGNKKIRKSWLGLLNMILAMATSAGRHVNLSMQERSSHSEVYFTRAKTLCIDHMLTGASVEIIQVMLLMTQYLQGTHRSIKTWAIHGLAVKAAFQLGLHSSQALPDITPLERETRLRTWYGCVVLDRTLSMTFGRPPSIPQAFSRLPLPSHSINGDDTLTSWSFEESSTLFWTATINLYNIGALIIQDLYGSNIGDLDCVPIAEKVSAIFQVEQRLFDWKVRLSTPITLVETRDLSSAEGNALLWKFRVILTLRYHNLRILAHRPVLDHILQLLEGCGNNAQELAILSQMGQMSIASCLESAHAIIDIVGTCIGSGNQVGRPSFLGAWWFTLYFTLNAALVMASVMTIQLAHTSNTCPPLASVELVSKSLDHAIATITKLDHQNHMLEKCVKFLATLRYLLQTSATNSSAPIQVEDVAENSATQFEPALEDGGFLTSVLDLMPTGYTFDLASLEGGDLFMSPGFVESMARESDILW